MSFTHSYISSTISVQITAVIQREVFMANVLNERRRRASEQRGQFVPPLAERSILAYMHAFNGACTHQMELGVTQGDHLGCCKSGAKGNQKKGQQCTRLSAVFVDGDH